MRTSKLNSIQLKLASPKEILAWSFGEVLKPETINYRTFKPEKDGLFCEKIFGPTRDYCCYCGKYRGIRYKGIVCDRCGVEITGSNVRREKMGHINLAVPVSHIWFLRGIPSSIGMVLKVPRQKLEKVIYFVSYIITSVSEEAKENLLVEIEKEYKKKIKEQELTEKSKVKLSKILEELKRVKEEAVNELKSLSKFKIISEIDYQEFSLKYGEVFEAETGAEAIFEIFKEIDLKEEIKKMEQELEKVATSQKKKLLRRLRFFQGMAEANIRPEWMFLTVLPVLPPDLRPMVQLDGGRYASSDLNDLYRRVINRNNRLKYLNDIAAPEVIIRNEKRMLQEAVDALIDNGMRTGTLTRASTGGRRLLKSLADMLKGKKGRFRRNLLGKRVDYSGRGVIVVGPELKIDQVGLPKEMALEIFKPFVIKGLLEKELAYNVRGASKLIEEQTNDVWAILEQVASNKVVLLNRAPTLHRISVQAFKPNLIEGKAIRLPALVCSAFNADFDGDQMAVHLPLSDKAQKEGRELMLSSNNLLKPATGQPVVYFSQDMVLGSYWLSLFEEDDGKEKKKERFFSGIEEVLLAYDLGKLRLQEKIKIRGPLKENVENKSQTQNKLELIETTAGRIIFNQALPDDFPFRNKILDSGELRDIVWKIIDKYDNIKAAEIIDKMKKLGFEHSTLSGISIGMNDFVVPPQKKEILAKAEQEVEEITKLYEKGFLSTQEKSEKVAEIWTAAKLEVEKKLLDVLPKNGSVFIIADSGCRGSWVQPVQISGMRGLMVNPSGEIIELPVKSSFKEGLKVLEYFISTHGARKGTSDTALGTSKAGYLTRRLVDVAHDVITREKDCGDTEGAVVDLADIQKIGQDMAFKIAGKVSMETVKTSKGRIIVKKNDFINWQTAREIVEDKIVSIKVRSVLSCKSLNGICQKCYGWDMGNNKPVRMGEAVGVVAAQSIGEPGTQLTLRTFHTGGIAGTADITVGLPRIEEVFEARAPKGEAVISAVDGKVISVEKKIIKIKPFSAQEKDSKKVLKSKKSSKEQKKKNPEVLEYDIADGLALWVSSGDKVIKGQQLCEGSINLNKLYRLLGKKVAQEYILQEIQRTYVSQGVKIHDKHIEVIVRQMFSRVKIIEAGDSHFISGEIIETTTLEKQNIRLKNLGKKPATAKEVLLGISRVSLTSDSFLSAASFQHTSKILIKTAMEGGKDELNGLKENVIVGKLIPVGTGFRENKGINKD